MHPDPCLLSGRPTLEGELSIAAAAEQAGDWKHALHHVLGALAIDPFSDVALQSLRRLHTQYGLMPTLEADHYFSAHLARAYLLADLGRLPEAFVVVARVDEAMPELGLVRLLNAWIRSGPLPAEVRMMGLQRVVGAAQASLGRLHLLPGERAALEPYAELAEAYVEGQTNPMILGLLSGIFRRVGRTTQALTVLGERQSMDPSVVVPAALALRAGGRPEVAAQRFAQLYATTGDPAHLLEQARALGDAGRYADALAALAQLQALPEVHFDQEFEVFRAWLEACARGEAASLRRDYDWVRRWSQGHGSIIQMQEISSNLLLDPSLSPGTVLDVRVPTLESPSARLALALLAGSTDPRVVPYAYEALPEPDPRQPRDAVSGVLWREEDGVMVQAVAPPPEHIRALVAELAVRAPDLFSMWELAGELAPLAGGDVQALAAAMVYPELPRDNIVVPDWIYLCQVAAACLIARSGGEWAGSLRRQALLDRLRGPSDWTTAAAALVLAELGLHEAEALPEIRRELLALAREMPQQGHCSYGATLALAALKVPLFEPTLAQLLAQRWLSPPAQGSGE